jgi:hypothetical protein
MKIHETEIKKYKGTIQELARDIADLRYDALVSLFNNLGYELSKDKEKNFDAGKHQVSSLLYDLASVCNEGGKLSRKLWDICKKHIPKEEGITPEVALDGMKKLLSERIGKKYRVDHTDKYSEWYNEYRDDMTWKEFNEKYIWCDRCKSYQEGSCLCYAR